MSSKVLAGRYELLEKIGEGGMSVVYKAHCRLLNRYVAIKILKPEFIKDNKFIESFRRESQAAASLSHPNIVNIYDVGREGNIHYIVMELVEGQVLSDVIKEEGPLPYKRVIEITKQVAAALGFAHKNHIIHRDVKPHNILITTGGVAKITDFGIAKAVNATTIVDDGKEGVMGSVHYFSPEQARGGYVDEKSDIYSLGIVMYEMLTGNVPFDGDNPVSVALMHINDEIKPPSQVVEGIPPALEQIVMKATDKYQVNRFKSAQELIDALSNIELVSSIVGDSVYIPKEPKEENHVAEEDFQDDEPDTKQGGKKKRAFVIILIAILAILAGFFGVWALSNVFQSKPVTVPDVTNMTYDEAETRLGEVNLKIEKGDEVVSDDVEQGKIVSQDPEADTQAKEGNTITVNISKGNGEVTVPNLVGKTKDEAKQIIESSKLDLEETIVKTDVAPEGQVLSQIPGAGETVKEGDGITITVSDGQGIKQVRVPYLIGKAVDDAKNSIEDAGLKVGKITYDYSNTYEKNKVVWQQYEASESVKENTSISIKVSKGEEPEQQPQQESKTVNLYIDYSGAANEVFALTVTLTDESGTRNVINNEQRVKSDKGETVQLEGTGKGTVVVIFDNQEVGRKNIDFSTGTIT